MRNEVVEKILLVNVSEGCYVLKQQDILYLEASSNYTRLHLLNQKTIISARCIKKYQHQLSESEFVRAHNSFLVNIRHIQQVSHTKKILLSTDREIPVAKRRWKQVKERFEACIV